ncbi:MAG: ferredoxin-thioredoxin reductase catalytic domain-containing protein [Methanomassiliicoccales archaeon]
MSKRLWRCHVCNDIHLGIKGPEICPTCMAENAFVEIDHNEAMRMIGEAGEPIDTKERLLQVWEDFTGQNDYELNEDREAVEMLASGVLHNQESGGLKYCPCRATTGEPDKDLLLVCPCNFPAQQRYREDRECWCSLFVKG